MSSTTPYAPRPQRRKPSVEVYFVLYLTAIILLLGTTPSKRQSDDDLEEAIIQLIDTDFEVDVQKVTLIIPYIPAGSSADPTIASNKDTLNLIRAHGTFEEVRFRIVSIVDTLDDDRKATDVATLINESDTSVRFQWKATSPTKPAVYVVAVEGEASPIIPEGVRSDALREKIAEVIAERGLMKDTAYFSVTMHPVNSREDSIALRQPPLSRPMPGEDSLSISSALMTAINVMPRVLPFAEPGGLRALAPRGTTYYLPGTEWRQQIALLGAEESERLSVSSVDGDVRIVSRSTGFIEVAGRGPHEGSKEITLTLSTSQGKKTQTSFLVQAQTPSTPTVRSPLYMGVSRLIDMTSAGVDDKDISIEVFEDGKKVYTRPARFNYVPSHGITSVRFVRKFNGEEVDAISAIVQPLPKVDIKFIKESEDEVIVEATAYGGAESKLNLQVAKGNGREEAIPNSRTVDQTFGTLKQQWVIRRKSDDRSFAFEIHAWDQRGITYSSKREYPK